MMPGLGRVGWEVGLIKRRRSSLTSRMCSLLLLRSCAILCTVFSNTLILVLSRIRYGGVDGRWNIITTMPSLESKKIIELIYRIPGIPVLTKSGKYSMLEHGLVRIRYEQT
ncbi:hypothetical protein KC19_6G163800 [Ceratodon purpureus]|uniref:Uncharacterized protein n=1 Tax=Ceratodon purpureus TaxID=3225 RepID=A0A8T0HIH4_CERPU|nr:hypothetical protein KC19_6G163800 [Ceratodon purpureus]